MTRESIIDAHRRRLRRKGKDRVARTALAVGVVLGAVGLFHENGADILGDPDRPIHPQFAAQKNTNEYKRIFRAADSASKFAMQYTHTVAVASDASTPGVRLLGGDTRNERYVSYFNNGCLKDNAYDAGSTLLLKKNPVASVVPISMPPGSLSASPNATVASNEDYSEITVSPLSGKNLRFEVDMENAMLRPVGEKTKQTLQTYGCSGGIQSHEIYKISSPSAQEWVPGPHPLLPNDVPKNLYDFSDFTSPFFYVK